MVQLTRIYTRGGDAGETSLGDGSRVPKHALRVEAYGTVDEANAAIGLCRLYSRDLGEADAMLARIQNDLFDLGADLCTPEGTERHGSALRISAAQTDRLEHEIDALNAGLAPLNSFVLPGGTAGHGAGGSRTDQRRGGQILEPSVRSSVRGESPRERRRRRRRALGARCQSLTRAHCP